VGILQTRVGLLTYKTFCAIQELSEPRLFVWGKQDVSFPYSNAQKAKALVPHAQIVAVDDAAHWVNVEQAEQSNAALLAFLVE
jgi:pimeloyl-ACP methyl ester carboxylesterase